MKRWVVGLVFLMLGLGLFAAAQQREVTFTTHTPPTGNSVPKPAASTRQDVSRDRLTASLHRLPLHFEPTDGQSSAEARFVERGRGYNLFLAPTEAVLAFLGLSVSDHVSWGRVIEEAIESGALVNDLWLWLMVPGLCLVLLVFGFYLFGFALDEILNPRLRRR